MKKILIFMSLFILLFLQGCENSEEVIVYSDDLPLTIEMSSETLKILQLTDLHLTYGIDAFDRATFKGMKKLIESDDFDLIVITGDLTLSPLAPTLFPKLVKFMVITKMNIQIINIIYQKLKTLNIYIS